MHKKLSLILVVLASLGLAGCGVSSSNPAPSSDPNGGFQARFALSNTGYILPFPNDLYFANSSNGTVNIQATGQPTGVSNPLNAINTLDGFSTAAPITATFTAPIDAKSLVANRTVYVFKVTTDPSKGYAVTGVSGLVPASDYALGTSPDDPSVLTITPTTALAANTSYMVVLTKGIKDTNGDTATPSSEFSDIENALAGQTTLSNPALAQIEPLVGAMLQATAQATQNQVTAQDVVLAWTFSTQSEGTVLSTLAKSMKPSPVQVVDTGLTTASSGIGGAGYAEIFAGTITIPYYLSVPTKSDPTAPLTQFWHGQNDSLLTRYNPLPVPTTTVTIPVLMTIPSASSPYILQGNGYPANGWPVVVFQHGIGQNREDMLAVADQFAAAGVAVIAIDLPLHGITNTSDPFYDNQLLAKVAPKLVTNERTFDLPPGLNSGTPGTGIAPSGTYFINLKYLLTDRDNLREGIADLLQLTESLPGIRFTATTAGIKQTEAFNSSETYFVGHSLGAIVGIPYLAEVPNLPGYGSAIDVRSATLAMPGGKVPYLLKDSPTFAPQINQGLAQAGIQQGTEAYFKFFQEAQTIVDSGDPINYASLASHNVPINMYEVVGNSSNPPDQVVPNSSTQPLINAMNLTAYSASGVNLSGVRGVTQFTAGSHGSLLDPSSNPTVFKQMQLEMQVFVSGCIYGTVPGCPSAGGPGNGRTIDIGYPSVVK